MIISVPEYVQVLVDRLNSHSFEAYVVGGCVRDSLLGRIPEDWDICTSAPPWKTKEALSGFHIWEPGIRHGTVCVLSNGLPVEITTYRCDGPYSDYRRPDSVTFTSSLQEDLRRRDFTINAMAYSKGIGLIDLFHGQQDLDMGIIRCVGNPQKRFCEDALRILRALRFSSVLSFTVEDETAKSIIALRNLLEHIAPERILAEFKKLLCGKSAGVVLKNFHPVFCEIIPELSQISLPVWNTFSDTISTLPPDFPLRFSVLLQNSTESANSILTRLRMDNQTRSSILTFLQLQSMPPPEKELTLKHLIYQYGTESIKSGLLLWRSPAASLLFQQILEKGSCLSLKQLKITGYDLKKLGLCGPEIGNMLNQLLFAVMEGAVSNETIPLKNLAVSLIENHRK